MELGETKPLSAKDSEQLLTSLNTLFSNVASALPASDPQTAHNRGQLQVLNQLLLTAGTVQRMREYLGVELDKSIVTGSDFEARQLLEKFIEAEKSTTGGDGSSGIVILDRTSHPKSFDYSDNIVKALLVQTDNLPSGIPLDRFLTFVNQDEDKFPRQADSDGNNRFTLPTKIAGISLAVILQKAEFGKSPKLQKLILELDEEAQIKLALLDNPRAFREQNL